MRSTRFKHPKLFVAIAALVVVATGAVAVVAQGGDPSGDGYLIEDPVQPTPEPTPGQEAFDLVYDVLAADPISSRILSQVEYTVLRVFPHYRERERVGIAAHVELDGAIASEGPWLSVECSGTRQYQREVTWSNVTFIVVSVSDDGELLEFVPRPPGADADGRILDPPVHDPDGRGLTTASVRDLRDGSLVFEAAALDAADAADFAAARACPRGTEDSD